MHRVSNLWNGVPVLEPVHRSPKDDLRVLMFRARQQEIRYSPDLGKSRGARQADWALLVEADLKHDDINIGV